MSIATTASNTTAQTEFIRGKNETYAYRRFDPFHHRHDVEALQVLTHLDLEAGSVSVTTLRNALIRSE